MKKFLLILLVVGMIGGGGYLYLQKSSPKKKEEILPVPVVVEEPKKYKLSLVMVGDALIHDGIYKAAYNASTKTYDFTEMLSLIKPIVKEYDLAYYNQETILGGTELGLSGYPNFNSPYEVGDAFVDAGFNLVGTATNHTYDKREQGILNSINYWKTKKDVVMSGTSSSLEERNNIDIYEKNNITYAFISYTKGLNGSILPKGKEYLVNVFDYEQAKKDIESVRDKVDVVMVAMHWGKDVTSYTNPSPMPWTKYGKGLNPEEQASYLASLGVDIIIGTHPHIINPIEWIDNTLVIYSLGNFISAQATDSNYNKRIGLMSSVDIVKTVFKGETKVELNNLNNELVYTHQAKGKYQVIPFSLMNETYNKNYVNLYNTYSKVVRMMDQNISVKPLESGE